MTLKLNPIINIITMKKIINVFLITGVAYILIGSISMLYSHFCLDGIMLNNKFDELTKGIFNLSCYLGIFLYYFLGQKIFFYILGQLLTLSLFLGIIKVLKYFFHIK